MNVKLYVLRIDTTIIITIIIDHIMEVVVMEMEMVMVIEKYINNFEINLLFIYCILGMITNNVYNDLVFKYNEALDEIYNLKKQIFEKTNI